ncbi:S8 family serine peptidase [Candidatus Fermentibacteria bacterium]|nr:S8 family serine peptidase [Candidatus Fermentibacteria bacterium]
MSPLLRFNRIAAVIMYSFMTLAAATAMALTVRTVPDGEAAAPAGVEFGAMQDVLARLVMSYELHGEQAALLAAQGWGIDAEGNRVRVIVEGYKPLPQGHLASRGAQILGQNGNLHVCSVTIPQLRAVADLRGVRYVRAPARPIPLVTSEGVALTGADQWHAHGFTGAGAKVAVVDVGFQNLSQAIAAGEIPEDVTTVDFTGYGMESLSRHGTAVAEIVHDMAPDADLTLINTYSEVDLANAKDYCIANGIRVINHSVGYANTGGHDGTGTVCQIADDAADHGIFWANAIGNHAYNHYRGSFVDADGDSLHDFAANPSIGFNSLGTLSAGHTVWIYLSWSAWPLTAEDYDLNLYRKNDAVWEMVASSCTRQTGSQPPTEEVGFAIPSGGEYAVAVKEYHTTQPNTLTIVSAFHSLQYRTFAGSLLQPADAVGAFAVGAIAKENWTTGPQEASSSQGPTYDGRTKPEIAGPDRVATFSSGPGFSGTSVASPHVAGAATLVIGAFPEWTLAQVWDCLQAHAIDMGQTGPDNIYGWGRLDLPLSIDVNEPAPLVGVLMLQRAFPNPFTNRVSIAYRTVGPGPADMAVYNLAGERVAGLIHGPVLPGAHEAVWDGRGALGAPAPSGVYFVRAFSGGAEEVLPLVLLK